MDAIVLPLGLSVACKEKINVFALLGFKSTQDAFPLNHWASYGSLPDSPHEQKKNSSFLIQKKFIAVTASLRVDHSIVW